MLLSFLLADFDHCGGAPTSLSFASEALQEKNIIYHAKEFELTIFFT